MQDESQTTSTKTEDMHILRLGYYDHANLLPLLYPLDAGWTAPPSPWRLETVKAEARSLEEAALNGELDAAFLSPAFVFAHASSLTPLGAWGLAADGRIDTALLLAPKRLDLMDGGEAAIAPEAEGSTAEHLLRILLKPYYDITLNLRPPGEDAHNPWGARLLYGDRAAREAAARPKGWEADDLGVAWFVLTGLPMVWQILATRRDLEAAKPGAGDQIQALLKSARRIAQEQEASVLAVASRSLGMTEQRVKELFGRQRFTLGDNDKKGLARFLDFASRAGLIAH